MRFRGWTTATSWGVALLWAVVSVGVGVAGLSALALPTWFVRTNKPHLAFGVYWWTGPREHEWANYFMYGVPGSTVHQQVTDFIIPDYAESVNGDTSYSVHSAELGNSTEDAMSSRVPKSVRKRRDTESLDSNDTYEDYGDVWTGRWSITEGASIWVIVGAMYGGSAVVLGGTGIGGPPMLLLVPPKSRPVTVRLVSNVQAAAVSVEVLSLVLYPLGLGSMFARSLCGTDTTTIYSSGDCTIGYGYFLAIVSTTVSVYCPVLARLIIYRDYAKYWTKISNL